MLGYNRSTTIMIQETANTNACKLRSRIIGNWFLFGLISNRVFISRIYSVVKISTSWIEWYRIPWAILLLQPGISTHTAFSFPSFSVETMSPFDIRSTEWQSLLSSRSQCFLRLGIFIEEMGGLVYSKKTRLFIKRVELFDSSSSSNCWRARAKNPVSLKLIWECKNNIY